MTRSAFDPTFEELVREIPIFPLGGVLLLPGGKLPLNIFEPRYMAMVDDVITGDRLIGMIQPSEEDSGEAPPKVYETGCVGRLTAFSETDDGRFLITLSGLIRFNVEEELDTKSYRRVRANYDRFRDDLEIDPGDIDRDRLLKAVGAYFEANSIEGDWETIEKTADERLVTSLAMICPLAAPEKQAVLEAITLPERCETLTAIMEMAVHKPRGDAATH